MSGDLGDRFPDQFPDRDPFRDPFRDREDSWQPPGLSGPHDLHDPGDLGDLGDPRDPAGRLLGLGPTEVLPVPSGSFERIRRRATRRRRVRALAGGGVAVAVAAGSLYLAGVTGPFWNPAPPVTATGGTSRPAPAPTPHTPHGSRAPSPSASSDSTSAPVTGPSASPVPSTGAEGASLAPYSSPATPAGSGTGVVTICATTQLTAALGGSDAGAGNLYRYLVLTNHGTAPCVLAGFPGLSLLDAQGRQLGAAATFDHSIGYTQVTLAPGASASDTIHTLNAGATSCSGTSSSLRIYPPGDKAALVIPGQVMLCGDQLSVSPFTTGSGGNPPS